MRGKAQTIKKLPGKYRITPAHAGKSATAQIFRYLYWDHPRTCGEKTKYWMQGREPEGSPPHMRGKVTCFEMLA